MNTYLKKVGFRPTFVINILRLDHMRTRCDVLNSHTPNTICPEDLGTGLVCLPPTVIPEGKNMNCPTSLGSTKLPPWTVVRDMKSLKHTVTGLPKRPFTTLYPLIHSRALCSTLGWRGQRGRGPSFPSHATVPVPTPGPCPFREDGTQSFVSRCVVRLGSTLGLRSDRGNGGSDTEGSVGRSPDPLLPRLSPRRTPDLLSPEGTLRRYGTRDSLWSRCTMLLVP